MLDGFDDRSAYALCTFAYCEGPGHEPIVFEGKTPVSLCFLHLLSSLFLRKHFSFLT